MCLVRSTPSLLGVKSPQPFDTLFDSLIWVPFSLALHLCSIEVITKWCKIYTKTDSRFQKLQEFGQLQTSSGKSKKLQFSGLHLSKNCIPSPKILFTDSSNIVFNYLCEISRNSLSFSKPQVIFHDTTRLYYFSSNVSLLTKISHQSANCYIFHCSS